jgi:protein-disulfide isomerase
MGTYVCVLGIFILASLSKSEALSRLPVRLGRDLAAVFSRPVTLAAALIYLAGAVSVVAFFPTEADVAQQAASAPAATDDVRKAFEDAWLKQPRVDLGIPAEGAKVIIVKFNDYECPGCRQAELLYKPIVDKFATSNPGAVRYVVKDWPWNRECNFNTNSTIPGHEAACVAAAAARMARERGKYDEMAAWLYANQGTTPDRVRAEAIRLLGITDFDQQYPNKIAEVRRDVADGGVLAIRSTPSYFINGVRLPTDSMLPAQLFELAISIELKK